MIERFVAAAVSGGSPYNSAASDGGSYNFPAT
jgi:hypothetical protein